MDGWTLVIGAALVMLYKSNSAGGVRLFNGGETYILIDDGTGTASAEQNYFAHVLAGPTGTTGFARHYRPQDVYISELFGGLAQLDNGVTTVHDVSQIHHSPAHSDAAIQAHKARKDWPDPQAK